MSLENATDGYIYIQSDLSYDFIFDELAFQIHCSRTLDIRIFVSLKSQEQVNEESFYTDSIVSISKIYPLLLQGEKLQAKYVKVTSNSTALFPHNIVTSHYLISISQDKKCAIVTKAKKIIESAKQTFMDVFPNGTNFVTPLNIDESILHTLNSLFSMHKSKNIVLYSMDYEPCITVLSDNYIFDKAINKENAKAVKFIETYNFVSEETTIPIISYFSLEGLKNFLSTGILFGIPKDFYTPFDKELKIRVIKNIYKFYKKGIYTPYIINQANFSYPKNFRYSGSGTIYDYFMVTLTDKNDMFNTLSLNESGLSLHFYDFVKSLPNSNLVFSVDESINKIIEETINILDCEAELKDILEDLKNKNSG